MSMTALAIGAITLLAVLAGLALSLAGPMRARLLKMARPSTCARPADRKPSIDWLNCWHVMPCHLIHPRLHPISLR